MKGCDNYSFCLSWLSGDFLEGKTFIEPYNVAGTLSKIYLISSFK